jgi:hypothetical protein
MSNQVAYGFPTEPVNYQVQGHNGYNLQNNASHRYDLLQQFNTHHVPVEHISAPTQHPHSGDNRGADNGDDNYWQQNQ